MMAGVFAQTWGLGFPHEVWCLVLRCVGKKTRLSAAYASRIGRYMLDS